MKRKQVIIGFFLLILLILNSTVMATVKKTDIKNEKETINIGNKYSVSYTHLTLPTN